MTAGSLCVAAMAKNKATASPSAQRAATTAEPWDTPESCRTQASSQDPHGELNFQGKGKGKAKGSSGKGKGKREKEDSLLAWLRKHRKFRDGPVWEMRMGWDGKAYYYADFVKWYGAVHGPRIWHEEWRTQIIVMQIHGLQFDKRCGALSKA